MMSCAGYWVINSTTVCTTRLDNIDGKRHLIDSGFRRVGKIRCSNVITMYITIELVFLPTKSSLRDLAKFSFSQVELLSALELNLA